MRRGALLATIALLLSACSTPVAPSVPAPDETLTLEGLSLNAASATLAPRAKVASDALQRDIEAYTGDALILDGPADGQLPRGELGAQQVPQNLGVGDILISEPTPEAPEGIFARVTSVRPSGGDLRYDLEPASFEEAFEAFDLDMTKALSAGELESATGPQGLGGSATLNTQATLFDIDQTFDDYVICDSDGKSSTKDDQIKISGSFKANLETFAKVKISWFRLKRFQAGVELDERLALDVKGKCGDSYEEKWLIKEYKFKTFVVWIGPVPVVMKPYVKLYLGANGEVFVEVDIEAEQTLNGRYGVRYERGDGWDGIKEGSRSESINVNTLQGRVQARAWLGPKAGVRFYGGVADAYGFPKAFVDAEASVSATSSPVVDYCLSAGLSFSAGAKIKLIKSWDKDFGDIITKEILCKEEPYTGDPLPPDDPPAPSGDTLTMSVYLGSVTISAPGVSQRCYSTCTVEIPRSAWVSLSTGNSNTFWWGGCTANRRSSCTFTMNGDTTVHAEVAGPPGGGPLY